MSTERQKQANRRNARLSTGPRSATGKAISSQNSRTHGFSSKIAVLTEPEDHEIFDSRLQEYFEAYGSGRPADIFHAFAAVNAEFQYIFINRARAGFVRFARERALDQLWGPQPVPEDPNSAFDRNTHLTGYAVMRDFNQSEILLKMSRTNANKSEPSTALSSKWSAIRPHSPKKQTPVFNRRSTISSKTAR